MIKNVDYFGNYNRNKANSINPSTVIKTLHLKEGDFDLTYGFYENMKRMLRHKITVNQALQAIYDVEDDDDMLTIKSEIFATN